MLFKTVSEPPKISNTTCSDAYPEAYLVADSWDDWFKFNTLYTLIIVDAHAQYEVGGVKIGQFGMADSQRQPDLPARDLESEVDKDRIER